jgi:hypothetical protein
MLFEFWIELNSKIKIEFQIFKTKFDLEMSFGPLAWPNQPGWSNPTGQVLGQSNWTRPASVSPSRPSTPSPVNPKSPPTSPAFPGQLRWPPPPPPWAKHSPLRPLPAPPSGIRGDRGGLHAWDPLPSSTPVRCLTAGLAERAQVLALCLCSPVEAPDVVLPVHYGEVFPRPRLVGRAGTASPCRPGMHLGAE